VAAAAKTAIHMRSNMLSPTLRPCRKELMLSPIEPVKKTKVFFIVSKKALKIENLYIIYYREKKQKKTQTYIPNAGCYAGIFFNAINQRAH
jgi:hypothetical protein